MKCIVYAKHEKGARLLAIGSLLCCLCATTATAQTFGTGTFQGIIQSGSDNDEGFGFSSLTVSRTGTFSWRFNVGVNSIGRHYYYKTGKFDLNGHYHFEGPEVTD